MKHGFYISGTYITTIAIADNKWLTIGKVLKLCSIKDKQTRMIKN